MFNVMLDTLPREYKGFPICTDFDIGIQIMQALEDEEATWQEQVATALNLLFLTRDKDGNQLPIPDRETAIEGLIWFLFDWNHDNNHSDDKTKITDWDIDQWRIYSGFRQHYGINLQTDRLHFWEFMALLTTLPECAYTRVLDIRSKKITTKMSKEERDIYKQLKETYSLEQRKETNYTDDQKDAIDDFDRMMEEQRKIRESKKLAQEAFEGMI